MARANEVVRTLNRLSTLTVSRTKRPGMYADGGGLYLRVAEGGSKQWIYRYVTNGRCRDMGIGPCHVLTLAEARERARTASKLRLDGIDPIDHKRTQRVAAATAAAKIMTFKQCAEGFIRDNESDWTNPKHRKDWEGSLIRHVYPALGDLPVALIDTPLVLKVIKPLWARVPETASRVRGRIESVLGWATVHHYREGDNPARWQNHLEQVLPTVASINHHAALPYAQVADFVAKLRKETSVTARCLEFIALTAARLNEAAATTWTEIDLETRTWTVPAKRTKAGKKTGKQHKVPLSDAAIAILKDMLAIRRSDYIFPGQKEGRPIGHNALWEMAKRASGADITVHGLRSTFKDWASECTSFPNEVSEMALGHTIRSAVEKAYRRGDLFEKRRRLMDAWAEYCGKQATSKVVALRGLS